MKLYSDEEANYLCRDYRDIPFELRQILFDKILDDNHISQFNPAGFTHSDYSTPANINLFSEAVGDNFGVDSKYYRKEYRKIYDKNIKKKFDKVMEDRKRDDDIAKYENVIALLRTPKGEFKLVDLPDVIKKNAYSDATITDINGMVMHINEMQRDINKKEGKLARIQAEEIEMGVGDVMESLISGVGKKKEREALRGVDTSTVHNPSKASQAQVASWEKRKREAAEASNAGRQNRFTRGVEESKNEEYQI